MNHMAHSIASQLEALRKHREVATESLAVYLDGAIASLQWALEPEEYISLACSLGMGIDPTRPPTNKKPTFEVVR